MRLGKDWKVVLHKAWSVRLMLLAGLLSGCEAALPFFAYSLPPGVAAGLSAIVVMAALVARLVAQKDV